MKFLKGLVTATVLSAAVAPPGGPLGLAAAGELTGVSEEQETKQAENPSASPAGAVALSIEEFRKLHRELAASTKTACGIPWELTIREGRERALKEGKPLFIYALGGEFFGNG